MTSAPTLTHQFSVERDDRLDRVLADSVGALPEYVGLSRSQLKRWIVDGLVTVDGQLAERPGVVVKKGAQITVRLLNPAQSALEPFNFPLTVLFEDEALIVLDKPAGISMHPGAGNKTTTLANALLGYFQAKGVVPEALLQDAVVQGAKVQRPGIVHRLDKDTTGVVVVAKTVQAHAALSKQFSDRTVDRRYIALAFCTPRGRRPVNLQDQGSIDAPLERHPVKRKEMSIARRGGKRAVTHWEVKERLGYGCILELKLQTGRTHQIRIHLSHIECPVIGDRTYGDFSGLPRSLKPLHEGFGRQALHAARLEFEHPLTGKRLSFESAIPADMSELIARFRSIGATPS